MRDLAPGRRFGRFQIERKLGQGGMGAVFAAVDERGNRLALKLIAGGDEAWTRRFEREARATLAVRHENVVAVFALEKHEGLLVLPMELLEGGTLRDLVKRKGPLPWREAAAHGTAIARGLAAIHAAGFVHRDLKPANVLLDGSGRPKIADLGLVRRASGASEVSGVLTRTGEVLGTFEYLAPELAERSDVDQRADLYSLGATLYELVAGAPPFAGAGYALVAQHLRAKPASLVPKGVPRELDALVLRLLAKRPEDRPTSAALVADELAAMVGGAVRAPRPGRRGWLLVAAIVVALALASGVLLALRGGDTSVPAAPPGAPPPTASARDGLVDRYAAALAGSGAGTLDLALGHDELRHLGPVRMVAFFRGPKKELRLVSGGPEGLRIWDPTNGRQIFALPVAEGVRSLSVSEDGRRAAVGSLAKTAIVFDLWDRKRLGSHVHDEGQVSAAISPDGKWVVSQAGSTAPVQWASADGRVQGAPFESPRLHPLWFLRFTPDGRSVVAGHEDGSVSRLDLDTRSVEARAPHAAPAVDASWRAATEGTVLQDGTIVSVGYDDALVVDRPGPPAPDRIAVHPGATSVYAVAASPDGKLAVTGGHDGFVEVHDLTRLDSSLRRRFPAHAGPVLSVALDPAAALVATGSDDGTVRIFDIEGHERSFSGATPLTHRCALLSLALSRDGTVLLTTSEDRTVKRWDAVQGRVTATRTFFSSPVVGTAFVDDPKGGSPLVLSLERHHGLKIWRLSDGALLGRALSGSRTLGATGLAVRGDGGRAIVSNHWDAPSTTFSIRLDGEEPLVGPYGFTQPSNRDVTTYKAAFAAGDAFVLAGAGREKNLYVRGSGSALALDVLDGDGDVKDYLASVAFLDAAGSRVITGGGAGGVSIWDLASKTKRATFRCPRSVTQVAALDEREVLALSGSQVFFLDAVAVPDLRPVATLSLEKADDLPTCAVVDAKRKKLWLGTAKGSLLRLTLR